MGGKPSCTVKSLTLKYPDIDRYCCHELNKEIFEYLKLFVDDKNILTSSLIQNPCGKKRLSKEMGLFFNHEIYSNLQALNRLHNTDFTIFNDYNSHKKNIVLFLINHKFLLANKKKYPEVKNILTRKKIGYAMELLKRIDISEIRLDLEDKFFKFLQPKIFNHYATLLRFTKETYMRRDLEIKLFFQKQLAENGLKAEIRSRLKTIYSIHKKIVEKNLLYSQILDTIGLRIILDDTEQCYRTMGLILKKYPIVANKIKDYIAIPKNNGYQSIHMTILFEGHPVEIQLRTKNMHQHAQYGLASHIKYKKNRITLNKP